MIIGGGGGVRSVFPRKPLKRHGDKEDKEDDKDADDGKVNSLHRHADNYGRQMLDLVFLEVMVCCYNDISMDRSLEVLQSL